MGRSSIPNYSEGFSCTAQLLPSGSLKKKNEFHGSPRPSAHTPSWLMCWTGLASRPRPTSSARAASMSDTTSCRPFTEPGGESTSPVPIVTEQAEPGGGQLDHPRVLPDPPVDVHHEPASVG